MKGRPRLAAVVSAIGRVTFLEIVRDKVLYNIFVFAILLLGVGFLASRLTFVRPDRVIVDFGLSAIALASASVATFAGASVLNREFERRTIFVALSHPISRFQFILGKYAGIAGIVAVNWALLLVAYVLIIVSTDDNPGLSLNATLLAALALVLAQSLVVAAVALFFSSFTTTSLAVIMSVGIFLIGNNISQLRLIAAKVKSPVGAAALNALSMLLPNLETFNLGLKVDYALPVSGAFIATSILYGAAVTAGALVFAGLLVEAREV